MRIEFSIPRVRRMIASGMSGPEIASALGTSPASVRVTCAKHGIQIPRNRSKAFKNRAEKEPPIRLSRDLLLERLQAGLR